MIRMTDIDDMSLPERLQAMELLWQSLCISPEAIESPSWHGEVLADRLARAEAGRSGFLSLEEAKVRLFNR